MSLAVLRAGCHVHGMTVMLPPAWMMCRRSQALAANAASINTQHAQLLTIIMIQQASMAMLAGPAVVIEYLCCAGLLHVL